MTAALAAAITMATLTVSAPALAAGADTVDTVVLRSGQRVQGTVYSDVPAEGVKVRTLDGATRFYPRASVQSVVYAGDAAQTPPAPNSVAVAPPPAAAAPPSAAAAPAATPPAATQLAASPAPARTDVSEPVAAPMPVASWSPGSSAAPPVRRENIKPLWITGLSVMLGVWVVRGVITAGVCASAGGCDGGDAASTLVPVIGAYAEFAHATSPYRGALLASGLVETGGLVLLITGLAVHRDVRADIAQMPILVAPMATVGGGGLTLAGTF